MLLRPRAWIQEVVVFHGHIAPWLWTCAARCDVQTAPLLEGNGRMGCSILEMLGEEDNDGTSPPSAVGSAFERPNYGETTRGSDARGCETG